MLLTEPITIVTTCKSICREEVTKTENGPKIKLSFLDMNTGELGLRTAVLR